VAVVVAVGASVFWLLVLPAIVSFRFAYVPSESMAPTLHAGDLVLAEQHPGPLQEGDILMFRVSG
jgi:signal peptidase I